MVEEIVPPLEMIKLVGGTSAENFKRLGGRWFEHFKKYGGLKPTERVLDVGCGCGRMAMPLTGYLTSGSYEGFDVVPELVEWCRGNITPRWPAFRFQLVDIFNKTYNPGGRAKAGEFAFPYGDGEFDFVFLTSVFTHMLPGDVGHYVREIARTLKRGGRVVATFFVMNEESLRLMGAGKSQLAFAPWREDGRIWVIDQEKPEAAVGYREEMVRGMFEEAGLRGKGAVLYGNWSGRGDAGFFQDATMWEKG